MRGIDGSGDIDPTMNRPEVKIDKWNMQTTMETLGFTFRSNIFVQGEKPKTTKAEVDQFIKDGEMRFVNYTNYVCTQGLNYLLHWYAHVRPF